MKTTGNGRGLTARQQRFCEEYVEELDAKRAYMIVYDCKRAVTAQKNAERLLRMPAVREEVARLKVERAARTKVGMDYVVGRLQEVAERCMRGVPMLVYDRREGKMVPVYDGQGQMLWRMDSAGAVRALELLGKHVGAFDKEVRDMMALQNPKPIEVRIFHSGPPLASREEDIDMTPWEVWHERDFGEKPFPDRPAREVPAHRLVRGGVQDAGDGVTG